jgi:glycosyltransferase involved in cell wall biosynthesis
MMPTIAVVIPNRNDSDFLRVCLDSVLNQPVLPDQIVVVDDQSTDNSLGVMREKLSGVSGAEIVVNPTCLGTMGALNEGLQRVTCEYVMFLSSNDYLTEGIFERAKSGIEKAGSPGVWSAMVWASDENGNFLRLSPSPVVSLTDSFLPPDKCVRLALTLGNWFTGTTLIYHRETLREIGGFDTAYQGLADLLAALTLSSLKGASYSPEPFGVMRMHSGGTLWKTLTNPEGLEAILGRIEKTGPELSPALFTRKFCERTKHRFRFAAIRASEDGGRVRFPHAQGIRYAIFDTVSPILGGIKKLRIALAYLLLRPFDVIPVVWYRWLGCVWIAKKHRGQSF